MSMEKFILDLIEVRREEAVTTSLKVAEIFDKRHSKIVNKIDNYVAQNKATKKMFFESIYKAKDNQAHRMYYMNIDGFSLLVMGFSGEKALEWKIKYIRAFNKMISLLMEKRTIEWQKTRELGKETRHELTDVLQKLEEYNKSQGSNNSHMVYTNYSKLVNSIVGVPNRDFATIKQLHLIAVLEDVLIKLLSKEIEANAPREHIYPKCKEQLLRFKEVALL